MYPMRGDLVASLDLLLLVYGSPLYLNCRGKKLARVCFLTFFTFRFLVSVTFWPTSGVKDSVDKVSSPLNLTKIAHFVQLFSCSYFYFWLIAKRKYICRYFITISSIIPSKYFIHSHLRSELNCLSSGIIVTSVILLLFNCLAYSYFAYTTASFGQSHIFQRLIMNKSPVANVTLIQLIAAVTLYAYDVCFDTYLVIAMAVFLIAYLAKLTAFQASLVYFTASINLNRKVSVRTGQVKQVWSLNRNFEQLFSTLPLICTLTSLATAAAYVLGDQSLFLKFIHLPWHLAIAIIPITIMYCSYPLVVLSYVSIKHENMCNLAESRYLDLLSRVNTSVDALILKHFIKYIKTEATVAGFAKIDRSFVVTTISSFLAMGVMLVQLIK